MPRTERVPTAEKQRGIPRTEREKDRDAAGLGNRIVIIGLHIRDILYRASSVVRNVAAVATSVCAVRPINHWIPNLCFRTCSTSPASTSYPADSLSRITPFRNGNTVVHVASNHFYDPRVSSLFIFTRRPASSDCIPPRECRPRVSSASVICECRSKDPGEIELGKLDDSFAAIAAVTSCLPIVSTVPMRDRACDLKKKKKSFGYSRRRNRERLR